MPFASPHDISGSMQSMRPSELRTLVRSGAWNRHTSGACLGYVQANLVILPAPDAESFLNFCTVNVRALPLLEVTRPGVPDRLHVAPDADLRTDVAGYRVYRDGVVTDSPSEITSLWRDDFVAFLLGCSFTAEDQLLAAGVAIPHIAAGRNVAMFRTNLECTPVGPWHGATVVSMRPINNDDIDTAVRVTERLPLAHGAPVHIGDPAVLGIPDLSKPDWGDVTMPTDGQTPVFWACGVPPAAVIAETAPALAITHAPGHMFVTDMLGSTLINRHAPLAKLR